MKKNEAPLVAVLMSVYHGDRADWFRQSLVSMFTQEYPRDRMRIYLGVDGPVGSDIEKIIQEYGAALWKVVRSAEKITLPRILNRLIECLDEEEYVLRMDSDDICLPNRFRAQVSKMEEDANLGILGSAIFEFDEAMGATRVRAYPVLHEQLWSRMHLGLPVAHPTVCIRRSALRILGKYDETTPFNQDVELWFRAMAMGIRFANIPEPLLRFRCNHATLKRRTWKKAREELKFYLKGVYRLHGFSPKLFGPILRFLVRILPLSLIRSAYNSDLRYRMLGGGSEPHLATEQENRRPATA